MSISIITIEDCKKWDETVRSFADFDVYYLSGYLKGFQIHGDGEPLLFYYQSEDGKCRGINAVMKRNIFDAPEFRKIEEARGLYDLSTPYGYGGWLFEGEVPEEFKDEYVEFCRARNYVSEFIRFNPMTDNGRTCSEFFDVLELGKTIFINTEDFETTWASFTSKNRNKIRKAEKNGVTVKSTDEAWIIDEFMEIYNETMDRDRATDYYYFEREYYESICRDLKNNFRFFYAEHDGKIIAVTILLFSGKRMHYHLSESRSEYLNIAPTNLMLCEAAKFASEHGFKSIHLGGGVGSGEDSLYQFKKGFNRNENAVYRIGKVVFDEEKYRMLIGLRDNIENAGFFPLYRG